MGCQDEIKRMIIKRGAGVPTVPLTTDHRDGTWVTTDIYEGEFYQDTVTGTIYSRDSTGITTPGTNFLPLAGGTMTGDIQMTSGSTLKALVGNGYLDLRYGADNTVLLSNDDGAATGDGIIIETDYLGLYAKGGSSILEINDSVLGSEIINIIGSKDILLKAFGVIKLSTNGNINSSDLILPTSSNTFTFPDATGTIALNTSPVVNPTTPYTSGVLDIVLWDCTAGNKVLNLPVAATSTTARITVKKTDSSSNTITIDGNASETIDGQLTRVLGSQYDTITIVCDGSNWYII